MKNIAYYSVWQKLKCMHLTYTKIICCEKKTVFRE